MLVFQVFSVVLPVSIKLAIHGSGKSRRLGRPAQIVWWLSLCPERRVGQISNDGRCIDSHREGSVYGLWIGVVRTLWRRETISISSSKTNTHSCILAHEGDADCIQRVSCQPATSDMTIISSGGRVLTKQVRSCHSAYRKFH